MTKKTYRRSRAQELAEREPMQQKEYSTKNTVPTRKTKEINGRILPYYTMVEEDQAEKMQGVNINDFQIDNIIEVGGTKNLEPTYLELTTEQQMELSNYYANMIKDQQEQEDKK